MMQRIRPTNKRTMMQRIELIEKDFYVFLNPSIGRLSFIRHYAAEPKITHFDLPESITSNEKDLDILSQALPLGLNFLVNVIQDLVDGIIFRSIPPPLYKARDKNLKKDLEKLSEEIIKFLNERQDLLLTIKKENNKTFTNKDIESTATIQDLPNEILLYILSFLSIHDLSQTLLVSKLWLDLTISNDIWRPLLQSSSYWDRIKQDDLQQTTYFDQFKVLGKQSVHPNFIRLRGDLGSILEMTSKNMEKDASTQNKLQNLIKKLGTPDIKSNFYFLLCDDQSILDFLYGKEFEFEKISILKCYRTHNLMVLLDLAVKYDQMIKVNYLINLLGSLKILNTQTLVRACSIAIKYHHLNIMKLLLVILKKRKANINRKYNDEGLTLLQQTIISENKYAFELLMSEWHADLHALNEFGYTALHLAVSKKLNHWIELLLAHGADPNFCNRALFSPYYLSIEPLNIDIAKLLIAHAEKKNITLIPCNPRNQYKTPLEACDHRHPNINEIEKYLEQEPLLKLMSYHNPHREGKTPLHEACHPFTIIKLLQAGADPNSFDDHNSKPLHHAIAAGLYKKSIILLQFGAKLDVKNKKGHTLKDFLKTSPYKKFKEKLLNWIKHTEKRNHINCEILKAKSNHSPITNKVIVICKWYLNQTNRFAFHKNRKEEITFCQNLITHCNALKEKHEDLLKSDFKEKEKHFFQENKSASDNFKAALEQIEWELLYRDNTSKNNQTKLIEEPIEKEQEIWNSFLENSPSRSGWK